MPIAHRSRRMSHPRWCYGRLIPSRVVRYRAASVARAGAHLSTNFFDHGARRRRAGRQDGRCASAPARATLGPMAAVLEHCRDLPLETFAAGDTVLTEGSRSGMLYVLASGAVEVVKEGVQINVVAEPGTFFGEVALLLDMPHTASVRAVEPSTFRVATDPLAFIGSSPEIALAIARLLARRLHFVTTYLVDLKRQFASSGDHLAIVDEVLETLVHHHGENAAAGSDRCPEPDPTLE